jgi:hypothetical protein
LHAEEVSKIISSTADRVLLHSDFDNVGSRAEVNEALAYLVHLGIIERIARGIYLREPDGLSIEQTVAMVFARLGRAAGRRIIRVQGIYVRLGVSSDEAGKAQAELDAKKLHRAIHLLANFPISTIRAKSLENIQRWVANGTWVSALDEWHDIMLSGADDDVIGAMTGTDERSNRLRQSPPYVGLLSR